MTPFMSRSQVIINLIIFQLDKVLIFSAAVASLVAVGGVVWVFLTLKNVVENFQS